MNSDQLRVSTHVLRPQIDMSVFDFNSTDEVSDQVEALGQTTALEAMSFGLDMQTNGYNIFVTGYPGTGRSGLVENMAREAAAAKPQPPDICFIFNFQDPTAPKYLFFQKGEGAVFRDRMKKLVDNLGDSIPRVFESSDYVQLKSKLLEEREFARGKMLKNLMDAAKKQEIQLEITQMGIAMIALRQGQPITPEELSKLPEEERQSVLQRLRNFQVHVREYHVESHKIDREYSNQFDRLDEDCVNSALEGELHFLLEQYANDSAVVNYLQEVRADILKNFVNFLPQGESQNPLALAELSGKRNALNRYAVNLLVCRHNGEAGAPVVFESHPTFANLVGRVEWQSRLGVVYSEFTDIKAGSILRANGGYLILEANELFRHPGAWEALKRTLKTGKLQVEDVSHYFGFSTVAMRPEPIPVNVKVILIGTPRMQLMLQNLDEDYNKIFKVRSELEFDLVRDEKNKNVFARTVAQYAKKHGLLPFTREALYELLIFSARQAEHRSKISLQLKPLFDLLQESSYWAKIQGKASVDAESVLFALDKKRQQVNLSERRLREAFDEGSLLLDLKGKVVGQINGLSVHMLGEFAFGRPSRITARTHAGGKGIIDIARESDLSGEIHSKGVMTLAGFLAGKFGRLIPIGLTASIAFEQTYSEVDGDSASAAELVAIISSLTEEPIRQDLAITGSVNQLGEIQPIGGVNEKIEGFFDICQRRGLTGTQGVVFPERNIKNLVLKPEVVQAVAAGEFHLFAVRNIEQVLELMIGKPAGEEVLGGGFLEGTLYDLVMARIAIMHQAISDLNKSLE